MQHRLQRLIGWRGHFDEDRFAFGVAPVHTVQHQAVKVNVQIGGRTRHWQARLDQRDRATVGLVSLQTRLIEQKTRDGAMQHLQHGRYQLGLRGLPLALIGVMLALLLWKSTLDVFSMIGLVMLMGLVTKNAILLVDFANQARKTGATVADALLEAGLTRMRPIVMTTAAMVFGMLPLPLPLPLALNDGAERRRRAASPDGPRDHRRRHHLDAADAGGGAGAVQLSGAGEKAQVGGSARHRGASRWRPRAAADAGRSGLNAMVVWEPISGGPYDHEDDHRDCRPAVRASQT